MGEAKATSGLSITCTRVLNLSPTAKSHCCVPFAVCDRAISSPEQLLARNFSSNFIVRPCSRKKFRAIFPFRCKLLHCPFQFIRVFRQQRAKTGTGLAKSNKAKSKIRLLMGNFRAIARSNRFPAISLLARKFSGNFIARNCSLENFRADFFCSITHCWMIGVDG